MESKNNECNKGNEYTRSKKFRMLRVFRNSFFLRLVFLSIPFFHSFFFFTYFGLAEWYCILLSTTRSLIFCNIIPLLIVLYRCRIENNSKNIFMEITRSIYFLPKRKGILKLFFSIVFLTISLSLLWGRRRFQKYIFNLSFQRNRSK